MNIIEILGRVGREPEVRMTQSGLKVTTFSIAVNVRKGGQEETIWWRVTVWGDRFDKMLSFVKKGSALIVIGEMSKPTIYTDKEGKPQVSLEMTADILRFVPMSSPEGRGTQDSSGSNAAQAPSGYGAPQHQSSGGSYGGDFGAPTQSYAPASQQGTASHYTQSPPSDDQLPF